MTDTRIHGLDEVAAELAHRLAEAHRLARQALALLPAAPSTVATRQALGALVEASRPSFTVATITTHPTLDLEVAPDVAGLAARVDALTRGAAHRDGPIAEVVAALNNQPRSGTQRRRVLEAIATAGAAGVTDAELEDRLQLARPSPGNRRGELVADGLVEATGDHRPTRTGSPATVWRITRLGTDVLAYVRDQERTHART